VSEEPLNRNQILEQISKIIEILGGISDFIYQRLCRLCDDIEEDELVTRRKKAFQSFKSLIERYTFFKMLPRDNLGIKGQATVSYMFRIQHALGEVLIMIDMLGDDSFGDIYMDSFTNISSKVIEQFDVLKKLVDVRAENSDDGNDELDLIVKLEREIDEDNIVICRQISVKTGGESDFTCYMMRKIVAELEHISDYIKECAEIIADI
jgi:hypothetical protein